MITRGDQSTSWGPESADSQCSQAGSMFDYELVHFMHGQHTHTHMQAHTHIHKVHQSKQGPTWKHSQHWHCHDNSLLKCCFRPRGNNTSLHLDTSLLQMSDSMLKIWKKIKWIYINIPLKLNIGGGVCSLSASCFQRFYWEILELTAVWNKL